MLQRVYHALVDIISMIQSAFHLVLMVIMDQELYAQVSGKIGLIYSF